VPEWAEVDLDVEQGLSGNGSGGGTNEVRNLLARYGFSKCLTLA